MADARQALADFTVASKYARFRLDLGRREVYEEAVDRMMDMHYRRFQGDPSLTPYLKQCHEALANRKILGSQRNLQFGGTGVERCNLRGYNCSFSHCNRPEFFSEALWLLLCGCGVGFSVQKHHVAQLPRLFTPNDRRMGNCLDGSEFPIRHEVTDSIEGWADALKALIRSYMRRGLTNSVHFDYSKIRPEGAIISSSGGKAPGPKPLRDSLEAIRGVLDAVAARGGVIRPIDAYDIVMHAASCVRAGGIRRSATIALFSPDDEDMTNAKTGDWFKDNPQRRLSNNSAILARSSVEIGDFERLIQASEHFGEPGFYFVDDVEWGTNPCFRGDQKVRLHDGSERTFVELNDLGVNNAVAVDPRMYGDTSNTSMWEVAVGSRVVQTRQNADMVRIETASGHHVFVTRMHGFPVVGYEYRVTANKLEIGMELYINDDGAQTTSEIVSLRPEGRADAYCLTEPETNTIIVNGIVCGQCGEIGLDPTHVDPRTGAKESGWAFCNLTSVNVGACKYPKDFYDACKAAAYLGTFQAHYQDVGYLSDVSRKIMERDCLLGVSLTGMADNPRIAFDGFTLSMGAADAVRANQELAAKLGIRAAARVTTVKPEGTGSLVLKVGNGIHPQHSRRYLRYVEAGKMSDPVVAFMAEKVPEAVVPSAYAKDEFKVVFPIDLGDGDAWLKSETDPIEHLEKVRLVQNAWVREGTVRGRLTHNVSNTIQVPSGRWNDVGAHIWQHREDYAGVALLGASGDLDYPQCPFVEVLSEAQIVRKYGEDPVRAEKAREAARLWERLQAAWVDIDFTQMRESEDTTTPSEMVACAGGACVF